MKVLLDINDDKATFILELLQHFKYVKARPLTPDKAEILEELKDAIEEVQLIKAGKEKVQPLSEFLNDL